MVVDLSGGIDPAREEILASRPADALLREAVNMWIWDDAGEVNLPRVAVEAIGSGWKLRAVQANIARPDGQVVLGTCVGEARPTAGADGRPTVFGAGPLRFDCVEPFHRWTVDFHGPGYPTTVDSQLAGVDGDERSVDVEFHVEATMAVPPWQPGALQRRAAEVLSDGVEGQLVGARYEQLFRAEGWLRVGGDEREFSGGGLRIRRQGRRNSRELWGHCWQSAIFPSGRAFGYCCFPERDDGSATYNEGYLFSGDEMVAATAIRAPWMTTAEPTGGDVSVVLGSGHGEVSIEAETHASTFIRRVSDLNDRFGMPFLGGADRLLFHQGIAHYRWDGEEAYGMIERSYPLTEIDLE